MEIKHLVLVLVVLVVSLGFTSYYSVKDSNTGKAAHYEMDKVVNIEASEQNVADITEEEKNIADDGTLVIKGTKTNNVYVEIKDLKFVPREIDIPIGTTVVWVNNDWSGSYGRAHMIVSHTNYFKSERIEYNGKFMFTFSEKGKYTYFDPYYKSSSGSLIMGTGIINVEELE